MQSDGPGTPSGTQAIPPPTVPEAEPETEELHVHLPELSIWPITLAAGITLAGFGLVTTGPISFLGLFISVIAIAGWIRELLHERLQHPESH